MIELNSTLQVNDKIASSSSIDTFGSPTIA
jgi:hypothetical protein